MTDKALASARGDGAQVVIAANRPRGPALKHHRLPFWQTELINLRRNQPVIFFDIASLYLGCVAPISARMTSAIPAIWTSVSA